MKNRGILWDNVEVVCTSADIASLLDTIAQSRISVFNVIYLDALRLQFCVTYQDLHTIRTILQKRGDDLEIIAYSGGMQVLRKILRRPIVLVGILLIVFLTYVLPTRILFVQVEGCENIPARLIIEKAESCGIRFMASRRAVRSEKTKNALLAQMPQLQWVGVNTYGCTAVITVLERNDQPNSSFSPTISHIVALCDGIIEAMTVQQGNALCQTGQAVKRGQILVSGYMDCGICIKATQAKAEILGTTLRRVAVVSPFRYHCRQENRSLEKKYSLILGKIRINFFKGSGISGSSCAKIYEEKYLTLPGGFVLPVGIVCETTITYLSESAIIDSVEPWVSEFAGKYVTDQMISGSILQKEELYQTMDGYCRLDGIYRCNEIIGITRVEERITNYG